MVTAKIQKLIDETLSCLPPFIELMKGVQSLNQDELFEFFSESSKNDKIGEMMRMGSDLSLLAGVRGSNSTVLMEPSFTGEFEIPDGTRDILMDKAHEIFGENPFSVVTEEIKKDPKYKELDLTSPIENIKTVMPIVIEKMFSNREMQRLIVDTFLQSDGVKRSMGTLEKQFNKDKIIDDIMPHDPSNIEEHK